MLPDIGCISALLLVIYPVKKKYRNTDAVAKFTLIEKTAMHAFL